MLLKFSFICMQTKILLCAHWFSYAKGNAEQNMKRSWRAEILYCVNLLMLFVICLMDFVCNWQSNCGNEITSRMMESWWEFSKAFAGRELIFVIQQVTFFHLVSIELVLYQSHGTLGRSVAEDRSEIRYEAEDFVSIIQFSTLRWRHIGNQHNMYRMFLCPCFVCSHPMSDHCC